MLLIGSGIGIGADATTAHPDTRLLQYVSRLNDLGDSLVILFSDLEHTSLYDSIREDNVHFIQLAQTTVYPEEDGPPSQVGEGYSYAELDSLLEVEADEVDVSCLLLVPGSSSDLTIDFIINLRDWHASHSTHPTLCLDTQYLFRTAIKSNDDDDENTSGLVLTGTTRLVLSHTTTILIDEPVLPLLCEAATDEDIPETIESKLRLCLGYLRGGNGRLLATIEDALFYAEYQEGLEEAFVGRIPLRDKAKVPSIFARFCQALGTKGCEGWKYLQEILEEK
ncbi:hypothetical protein GMRT_15288 [Giardia muris]|uniref:Uncharacterized protein n=1 Tax=Giardia muris TaxID=5742 RepID=A0A4Z1T4C0_GIAMU|nr:hypothetical protein GMRT_15288 [Giardia muris]|eukprot:TNJ27897.1 hypothetical protein GMRT_15288 [Giardia muris]